MIDPRWLKAIENELTSGGGPLTQQEAELCTAAIKKLTPFKPDEAYMLVPRCEACTHWSKRHHHENSGFCMLPQALNDAAPMWTEMYDYILTNADFGCVGWEAK